MNSRATKYKDAENLTTAEKFACCSSSLLAWRKNLLSYFVRVQGYLKSILVESCRKKQECLFLLVGKIMSVVEKL